jgi:predicted DNA-binding transcriptional regulator YafY
VTLVRACSEHRRVRLRYRSETGVERVLEAEPWAVVVRHSRWYLLCHAVTSGAVRAYRVDRVREVEVGAEGFVPPSGLDPVRALEEHLAVGWEYDVEVLIEAALETVAPCLPRTLGRLERVDAGTTRLSGTTSNPTWYAEQLARVPTAYLVTHGEEVRAALKLLGARMTAASGRGRARRPARRQD